ncbi:MAG TPA: glycosyltransferase family 4 protein [Gemmatimonadota bacterium]|nr:glycosyltransferase family 4 protein [Gemmatimonadota bacterium]
MSRPLRFLHMTTFYPPYSFGGDAMYVRRLAHALGDAGHEVDIVHCIDAYRLLHPSRPETEFTGHPRVRVTGLRSRFGWLSPFLTHQTGRPVLKGRRIRRILAEGAYDVIHYHNISLLGPHVLTYEATWGRTLKIYTAHEHWLVCPMHVLWKYDRRPCEKPQCLSCVLRGKRPPQVWRYGSLLGRSSRHVDQFVAPSRFTARMHAERGFERPLAVLPYFLERVDGDWKEPGPRPQERPYFLFVGRLEAIKGLQELIDLWPNVPDHDLLVAGTGTLAGKLQAMAARDPRIRFLGPVPQAELGRLYVHAVACLVPSLTFETFGMVVIEAFARKTPVIARDLGALPEVVREAGGGFTYRTHEDLIAAMRGLAASPALRAELGESGYRAFSRLWSREAHLERYMELLREIAVRKFGRVPWEDRGP